MKRLDLDMLVLGPRPGKKSFAKLSEMGLTHCCTLLSEREQAQSIARISRQLECDWIWLPMDGGHLDTLREFDLPAALETFFKSVSQVEHPRVYLHCSAGIHRTGFFAYSVLRASGWTAKEASGLLEKLRPVTANQVGDGRIALAEELVQKLL